MSLKEYWKRGIGELIEVHCSKRGVIGLEGFMEIPLTINSGQKLVMWDVLVMNETRQSLIFLL